MCARGTVLSSGGLGGHGGLGLSCAGRFGGEESCHGSSGENGRSFPRMGLAGWKLLDGARLEGAGIQRVLKPPTPSSLFSSRNKYFKWYFAESEHVSDWVYKELAPPSAEQLPVP